MKRNFTKAAAVGVAAIALALGTSTSALAAPWPSGGVFVIPDGAGEGAEWVIGQYGIQAANNFYEDFAALYYPNEVYGGNDYFYCGDSDGSDSTVTEETNGDITVDCLPSIDAVATGLTSTLHFRLYALSDTGYLARQWIEVTNTTGSTIDISSSPVANYYYWNYYGWVDGTDPWETNNGASSDAQNGDVWGAGGSVDGTEIVTSAAWGDPCQASEFVNANPQIELPADVNVFAAGETKNIVTFMNMYFPATADAAGGAAAYDIVLNQAKTEFAAGLTGRLVDGLPDGFTAVGWDNSACAPSAELPNTGVDADSLGATGVAALGLFIAGCAAVVVRRRILG